MPPKDVAPALALDSFSCPHCGALAHQYWFECLPKSYARDNRPKRIEAKEFEKNLPARKDDDEDDRDHVAITNFIERLKSNEVTYWQLKYNENSAWKMVNMHL